MKKVVKFIILLLLRVLCVILLPFIVVSVVIAVPVVSLFLWIVEGFEIDIREMCEDVVGLCYTPIRIFFNCK